MNIKLLFFIMCSHLIGGKGLLYFTILLKLCINPTLRVCTKTWTSYLPQWLVGTDSMEWLQESTAWYLVVMQRIKRELRCQIGKLHTMKEFDYFGCYNWYSSERAYLLKNRMIEIRLPLNISIKHTPHSSNIFIIWQGIKLFDHFLGVSPHFCHHLFFIGLDVGINNPGRAELEQVLRLYPFSWHVWCFCSVLWWYGHSQ